MSSPPALSKSGLAARPILTGNLLGIASMVAWAAGFPAAEALLSHWEPLPLIVGRFAVSLCVLLPAWILIDGFGALRRARWLRGLSIGALAFGGGAYMMIVAQWLTDPVTVAIIAAASPIAATIVEMVMDGRKLRPSFALGLAASVIGGVIATGSAAPAQLSWGAFFAICSSIVFSWGSHATVRQLPEMTSLGQTTLTLAGGLLATSLALVIALSLGQATLPQTGLDLQALGLFAVYGIGGMAISQFLWIASIERLGVAVAAFHINVAPFYVMLIMVGLGQAWSWPQAVGAVIVGLGVVLSQR